MSMEDNFPAVERLHEMLQADGIPHEFEVSRDQTSFHLAYPNNRDCIFMAALTPQSCGHEYNRMWCVSILFDETRKLERGRSVSVTTAFEKIKLHWCTEREYPLNPDRPEHSCPAIEEHEPIQPVPCPACHSPAFVSHTPSPTSGYQYAYTVHCPQCSRQARGKTEYHAIKRWNDLASLWAKK